MFNQPHPVDLPDWLLSLLLQNSSAVTVEYVGEDDVTPFVELDEKDRERVTRYVNAVVGQEMERLRELEELGAPMWDNTTFQVACNVFELAKAPWSPLTTEEGEDRIRSDAPEFDNDGWSPQRLDKIIESAFNRVHSHTDVRPFPVLLPTSKDTPKAERKSGDWDALERTLKFTPIKEIRTESVEWLWHNRVPTGEITLLAGREGIGKSVIASWMASQVTLGKLEGKYGGVAKSVVYLATEDSWSKTIVPRMQVAGASTNAQSTIYRVEVVEDPLTGLMLPKDIEALRTGVSEHNVGLVMLDPFLSFVDVKLDSLRTRAVRQALEPLARMAHETGVAIVGLIHFTKSETQNVLDKIAESKAFTQVCRQVMVVGANPQKEDAGWGLLSVGKANLAPGDVPTLEYQIVGKELRTDDGKISNVGCLKLHGETNMSALTLIQQESDPRSYESEDAAEWLEEILRERKAVWAKDLMIEAKDHGFKEWALRRAKETLGVKHKKLGGTGVGTAWFLGITQEEAKHILDVESLRM